MGINEVYSLVCLMTVAKHVQICIIGLHQMGRLAMQLSCKATNNFGKFGSYNRRGCEVKNETPVIANTFSMRVDVCIGKFNISCGKDCIDQGSAISEGGGDMNASTLEALFTEHKVWLGKTFGNAPRVNMFIKVTKKDDI